MTDNANAKLFDQYSCVTIGNITLHIITEVFFYDMTKDAFDTKVITDSLKIIFTSTFKLYNYKLTINLN